MCESVQLLQDKADSDVCTSALQIYSCHPSSLSTPDFISIGHRDLLSFPQTPTLPPLWTAIISAYAITHYVEYGVNDKTRKDLGRRLGLVDLPYAERVRHWQSCNRV